MGLGLNARTAAEEHMKPPSFMRPQNSKENQTRPQRAKARSACLRVVGIAYG